MQNTELVHAITETNLQLEPVDVKLYDQLKTRKHTYVHERELISSFDMLVSENFARCQGIIFLDDAKKVGALAHNYPTQDPDYTLTGEWAGGETHLEDPRIIFDYNLSMVSAVHVYHCNNYEWSEKSIEKALRRIGIERVVHIPIKPERPNHWYWRHVIHDVKDGSVYVFPYDFDIGIKYHPR